MDISSLMYSGGIGLIIALTQICKQWVAESRWYPIIAIGFGVAVNTAIGFYLALPTVPSVFMGVIAGLIAAGIYSTGSTVSSK